MARMAIVLFLILGAACTGGSARSQERGQVNEITRQELGDVSTLTVWDAIQRLRPFMLRGRVATPRMAGRREQPYGSGTDSLRPRLLLNGMLLDIGTLRTITAESVASIRFVSAPDATTRYGTGFVNGLIEVVTH